MFFECNSLAQIFLILRVIFVMIVDVSSETSRDPFNIDIVGIWIDPLLLSKQLM